VDAPYLVACSSKSTAGDPTGKPVADIFADRLDISAGLLSHGQNNGWKLGCYNPGSELLMLGTNRKLLQV
jgi:hypothetical protein